LTQCHICGESLKQPSKCILCDKFVCQKHSQRFEVGEEKSSGRENKVNAYVCDECMNEVEELKKKPRQEWSDEDKGKSKGMIEKILMALGAAGMAIISAVFMFALWVYAKAANGEGEDGEMSKTEDSGIAEWSYPSEPLEGSFAEEQTFEEDQPGLAMCYENGF
jgi:hypothetical protein